MADKKITQLTELTTTVAEDQLLVVDDPNGTPASKRITIKSIFGTIPANTKFTGAKNIINSANTWYTGNVSVTGTLLANTAKMTIGTAPSSNNATTAGMIKGDLKFTNTHIYLAISNAMVRRVALSDFS
jgi:hypothetical protein